jgi:flagellar basal-body rod protein FlgB
MANVIKTSVWEKTGVDKFGKLLDLAAYRHKLIAGNIANATTPDYAARDIDFQDEIDKALGDDKNLTMKATSPKHIGGVGQTRELKVIETAPESEDDLNGVDIDEEITDMAVNQMRYTIGARILQNKMNFLRKAIKGR